MSAKCVLNKYKCEDDEQNLLIILFIVIYFLQHRTNGAFVSCHFSTETLISNNLAPQKLISGSFVWKSGNNCTKVIFQKTWKDVHYKNIWSFRK